LGRFPTESNGETETRAGGAWRLGLSRVESGGRGHDRGAAEDCSSATPFGM